MADNLLATQLRKGMIVNVTAQNKQIELEWLRLSGATWGGLTGPEGSGRAVSPAGDVNNDGYDDFLVGASTWDVPTVDNVGRAYLVYGGLGVTAQKSPGEAAVDGLVAALKDSDAGVRKHGRVVASPAGDEQRDEEDEGADGR